MGLQQQSIDQRLDNGELSPVIIAAHELKSPLALIRQLTLELQQVSLSPTEQAQLLEHILLTSERSLDLVSSLSKSAKLENSLFDTEAINLSAICDQVAHDMMPLYRAHNRTIEVARRRSRPVMAVANRELLQRIVRQFADNALHYSDDNRPVYLTASSIKGQAKISVRDYGPALNRSGFTDSAPDFRPLHERPESSGLGLIIAQRFAEAMNGKIGATKHRDGASFYIEMLQSQQLRLV